MGALWYEIAVGNRKIRSERIVYRHGHCDKSAPEYAHGRQTLSHWWDSGARLLHSPGGADFSGTLPPVARKKLIKSHLCFSFRTFSIPGIVSEP
jgi:hypothetical protein